MSISAAISVALILIISYAERIAAWIKSFINRRIIRPRARMAAPLWNRCVYRFPMQPDNGVSPKYKSLA